MVCFARNKLANALSYSDLIRHGKNAQPSQPTSNQQSTNTSSSNKKHTETQSNKQQQNTSNMHNSYPPAVGVPSKGLAVERMFRDRCGAECLLIFLKIAFRLQRNPLLNRWSRQITNEKLSRSSVKSENKRNGCLSTRYVSQAAFHGTIA
jgi:hypothetical protein